MSDRKYRTTQQLENDVRYNRRMQNTHKLRADAAQEELDRRAALTHPVDILEHIAAEAGIELAPEKVAEGRRICDEMVEA